MSNGIPRKLALAAFVLASAYSSAYSTAVYAADEAIQIAEEASESARSSVEQRTALVDKTARKVSDIRAALMAYYTDKIAWPASLDLLVAGGYYPKADWSTPYGNIVGAINGTSYVLSLTLPNGSRATPIGKLIAAKANGRATGSNNTDLTFTIGTPSQASIAKNMLSRVKDPNNAMANTMETAINMNSNNILDAGTVTADIFDGTTAKISGKTTTGQLEVADSLLTKGDAEFNGNVAIHKAVVIDGATEIKSSLVVQGKSTLADVDAINVLAKGNLAVNGSTTLNGATKVNNSLDVAGKSTLGELQAKNTRVTGTLDVDGATTLNGATKVNNSFQVTGQTKLADTEVSNLLVNGQLTNIGAMYLKDALVVDGTTTLKGATVIQNKLTVNNGARISGIAEVDGLQVNQNARIQGGLGVYGATVLDGTLSAGQTSLAGLDVAGVTRLNGDLIGTNATLSGTLTAAAVKANSLGYMDAGSWKDVATEINKLKTADTNLQTRVSSLESWKASASATLIDHGNRINKLESIGTNSGSGTWTTLYSNATGTTGGVSYGSGYSMLKITYKLYVYPMYGSSPITSREEEIFVALTGASKTYQNAYTFSSTVSSGGAPQSSSAVASTPYGYTGSLVFGGPRVSVTNNLGGGGSVVAYVTSVLAYK